MVVSLRASPKRVLMRCGSLLAEMVGVSTQAETPSGMHKFLRGFRRL